MAEKESWGWQPSGSPPLNVERSEDNWSQFDSSVNAVSFGFVATAILISMFLVMAIFERFLRPNSPDMSLERRRDIESQVGFHPKLGYPSPKVSLFRLFWLVFYLFDILPQCICVQILGNLVNIDSNM